MNNKKKPSIFHQFLRVLLPICLVAAGFSGWKYYKSQEMKVKKRPPKKTAMTVETVFLKKGDYPAKIHAMGTVIPSRKIALKSRVAGELISISDYFVRGGVVKKGEILAVLDDRDYGIELKKSRTALDKALSDLDIEQGNQKIAIEEYKLISQVSEGEIKSTDLALRKPQLAQARAAVESARADVEKAQLNLDRTTIRAPFNSLILEKNVDKGSYVSVQETLGTLVDTDTYYVEALVSPDEIESIKSGTKGGNRVIVKSQHDSWQWHGEVFKFTGEISEKSRMAGVLIVVEDPLGLRSEQEQTAALMINDYVAVEIFGKMLSQVVALPRELLRDDDTVWINNSGKLQIRPVKVVWKEESHVYINGGLSQTDEIVVSEIAAPVHGMALIKSGGAGIADEKKKTKQDKKSGNKNGSPRAS